MDKLDLIGDDVFSKENWQNRQSELDNVFLMTIAPDRVQAMKLFLDRGFSIGDRLTWKKLTNLYRNIPDGSLKTLLMNREDTRKISLDDVENLIRELAGDSLAKHLLQLEKSSAKRTPNGKTGDEASDSFSDKSCTSIDGETSAVTALGNIASTVGGTFARS
ncbi:hypothetical protein MAR_036614, partial [Mya arenaria]